MEIVEYLNFIKRNWKVLLMLTIVTTLSALYFANSKNKISYEDTIYASIGAKQTASTSLYESVQAADQFAETITGWFKDQNFVNKISGKNINDNFNISAKKQERQNISINFTGSTKEEAEKISNNLEKELNNQLAIYNNLTQSGFIIGSYSSNIEPKNYPFILVVIFGMIGGFILGQIIALAHEYFFMLATTQEQIISILNKKPLERLGDEKIKSLETVGAYLKGQSAKKVIIAGLNINPEKISKLLQKTNSGKTFQAITLPQDSMEIISKEWIILVCRLGKTKLQDLEKIQKLLPGDFEYLIVNA
jgi:capsular polysaccharide biosynthesis protein